MHKDEGDDDDVVALVQQHCCCCCCCCCVVGCARTKARVHKDEDKDEVHCQMHEDKGEGEGGQWHAMTRVTVVVMFLDA